MKRLTVVLLLLLVGSAAADEFPVGFVNGDGYSYVGAGVWTLDGKSYTRALYQSQSAGCWKCGIYYPGAYKYFYQYTPYSAPAKAETLPSYSDPQWKSKLLDIAANRDRIEGDIRKGAFEHAYYLQSIQALGLSGNFRWEGYGTVPPYALGGVYGNARMPYEITATNYGATASTQYGYSYNSIASVYGDTNLSALYQQAGQLTQQALKLGGDANTNFQGLIGQEGGNRARVAEILARGQMAHQVLQALQVPGETRGYSFKFKSGGQVERIPEPNVEPEVQKANGQAFATVFASRCAACHTGKDAKGKFTADGYLQAPLDVKYKVWGLLSTDDDKIRMPQGQGGVPGKRLTPEEFKAFIFN